MSNKYINDSLRKVVSSYSFNLFAGLCSIIALVGWALQTFITWSGISGVVGWLATTVIVLTFFMTLMVLVVFARKHYVLADEREANSKLLEHQNLNLQNFYHLRSAIDRLQKLEQEVLSKMNEFTSIEALNSYIELKEKDGAAIFKKFATKAVNNSFKLAKIYFIAKKINVGSLRLTVKAIISQNNQNSADWLVKTVVRDSETWQKLGNDDENYTIDSKEHKIGDNTDFFYIVDKNNPMFVSNDLKKLSAKYKNSSNNWSENYNATFVVPIATQYKESWMYFGFIALDSLNEENLELFIKSKDNELYQILKSLSEAIAIWHMVYNGYIQNVLKEFSLIQQAKNETTCTQAGA
ncbi:hypothetical protein [Rheinheimera texasensis]|uniref:hypothetical protein n=1 Tax=Rheinheimera texasensis TaxID=306205 RepID=UPI0004E0D5E4|nr:hypothetical protein [Rheinheimera texasensis]